MLESLQVDIIDYLQKVKHFLTTFTISAEKIFELCELRTRIDFKAFDFRKFTKK